MAPKQLFARRRAGLAHLASIRANCCATVVEDARALWPFRMTWWRRVLANRVRTNTNHQ
jgi:hypothetical protein